MKHLILAFFVLLFTTLGSAIIVADLLHGGVIHLVGGILSGCFLFAAVCFALPLRVKVALDMAAPYLPAILKAKMGG